MAVEKALMVVEMALWVVDMAFAVVEMVFVEVEIAFKMAEVEMALEMGENSHPVDLSLLLADHHPSSAPASCIVSSFGRVWARYSYHWLLRCCIS
jgi:hypothetical protein